MKRTAAWILLILCWACMLLACGLATAQTSLGMSGTVGPQCVIGIGPKDQTPPTLGYVYTDPAGYWYRQYRRADSLRLVEQTRREDLGKLSTKLVNDLVGQRDTANVRILQGNTKLKRADTLQAQLQRRYGALATENKTLHAQLVTATADRPKVPTWAGRQFRKARNGLAAIGGGTVAYFILKLLL